MLSTVIKQIAGHVLEKGNFVSLILLVAIVGNTYWMSVLSGLIITSTHKAGTDYSYYMVSYGLRDHPTHEEAIEKIRGWVQNENEARVAAVKTLCVYNPNRLSTLVEERTTLALCRIVD